MEHAVIIGAGHGGAQAAASLREEGFQGRVTLVSDERVAPYHRPPLSKAFLKDPTTGPRFLRGPKFFADHAIELLLETRASRIDIEAGRVALAVGGALEFSHLVLALGGMPRRLAAPGADLPGVRFAALARRRRGLARSAEQGRRSGGDRRRLHRHGGRLDARRARGQDDGDRGHAAGARARPRAARLGSYAFTPPILGRRSPHRRKRRAHRRRRGGRQRRRHAIGTAAAGVLVLIGVGMTPNVALAEAAGLAVDNGVNGRRASARRRSAHLCDRRLRLLSALERGAALAPRIGAERHRPGPRRRQGDRRARRALSRRAVVLVGPAAYQIANGRIVFAADDYVLSGDRDGDRFSVFHFSGSRLVAIDSVDSPAEHMLGRRMLAAGFSPTKEAARGGAAALKAAFMPTAGA